MGGRRCRLPRGRGTRGLTSRTSSGGSKPSTRNSGSRIARTPRRPHGCAKSKPALPHWRPPPPPRKTPSVVVADRAAVLKEREIATKAWKAARTTLCDDMTWPELAAYLDREHPLEPEPPITK